MTPRRIVLSAALVVLVLMAGRLWRTADAASSGGRMCEPETRPVTLSVEPVLVGDLGDRVTGPATVVVEAPGAVWVQLEVWPVDAPVGGAPTGESRLIGAVANPEGATFRIPWNATEPWPYAAISARAFGRDTCSRTSEPVTIILDQRDPKAQRPTGIITGNLGYPAGGVPEIVVYAIRLDLNSMRWASVQTTFNQTAYMIVDVEPGIYVVVAYLKSGGTFAGGYSQAVPCGLTVACTDHTLIPVTVTAGETTSGVNVRDWYAPPDSFPPRPE